ncbi:HD-GYP domain-containing protein [Synechococcus sp. PCC 7502]|uniref:HD domain-containing phosphohydrolase n=1 Tax=Synechococcus sp. PCC 7502 TaxID=1173263 RepID=UPI00029FBFA8|nr:HD domain-containing phosphohydrolase [Synechococcus sp. PCC 7502]AFY73403.1 HD-GYP domain-containing protein [Synechococcus sp. PCC 7502]
MNEDYIERFAKLNAIGIALSAETDPKSLIEMIVMGAKSLTNADGGTLYMVTKDQDALERKLKFEIMITDSLGIKMGGTTGKSIPLGPIPLYHGDRTPNSSMIAAYSAIHRKTINIPDAYTAEGFDFSGTRAFDQQTGYRSKSFLTVPMKNHENEIIGVLQLINAIDPNTQEIIPFSQQSQHLAESLASQAAVALTNRELVEEFRLLFESFIGLIAKAIDDKSPYTGGHCRRVPVLTMLLAQAACETDQGIFKDFKMTEEELYELKIAGLLHDCGKVVTPVHIVDKATKLETIYDRIHLIDTRFEVLKRDAEIKYLKEKIAILEGHDQTTPLTETLSELEINHQNYLQQLESDRQFLRFCNIGSERMSDQDKARLREMQKYRWINEHGEDVPFLTEDEFYNLDITFGTLTNEERQIINDHMKVTIEMLEALPYPKNLRRVPEYASGHHERMDGKGYPRGLTREQMSIPARMMGIADIFEALSATDRPYKKGKTLTECLHILGKMKLNSHIDPDLFDLFINEKVYLKYAEEFIATDQIDDVDLTKIPGYTPST